MLENIHFRKHRALRDVSSVEVRAVLYQLSIVRYA